MFWANLNDIRNHLMCTFIQYKDKVAYVEEIVEVEGKFYFTLLILKGRSLDIKAGVPFENISTRQLPLGYYNHESRGAIYLSRKPMRRWKHGLDSQNIVAASPFEKEARLRPNSSLHLILKYISDNTYPTVSEASTAATHTGMPVAFSRVMCIDANKEIYYCNKKVGRYIPKTGKIVFRESSKHLYKLLEVKGYEGT